MSSDAGNQPRSPQLVVTLPSGQLVVDLSKPVTSLGRSRDCTIRIDDKSISAQHCEVVKVPAGFMLVDHGSRNGTVLRNMEVSEAFLHNGDVFLVGRASVKYLGPDPDENRMHGSPMPQVALTDPAPPSGGPAPVVKGSMGSSTTQAPAPWPGAPAVASQPPAVAYAPPVSRAAAPAGPAAPPASVRKRATSATLPAVRPSRRRLGHAGRGIPLSAFVGGLVVVVAITVAVCYVAFKGPATGRETAAQHGLQPFDPLPAAAVRPDSGPAPTPDQAVATPPQDTPAAPRDPRPTTTQAAEPAKSEPTDAPVPAIEEPNDDWPRREDPGPVVRPPEPPAEPGGAAAVSGSTEAVAAEDGHEYEYDYEFMGLPGNGSHVCFVLDASASMSLPTAGGTLKRDKMKDQLIRSIEDLDAKVSYTVVFFTSEAYPMSGKFMPATAENKAVTIDWIRQFERRGATNLWSGLQKSLELVQKIPPEERAVNPFRVTLFVLSDGRVRDAQQILRAAEAAMKSCPVVINTISFDARDEVLAELAKLGGGECKVVK